MEAYNNLFDRITTECATKKSLVRLAKSTSKNFRLSTQSSLEKANELAFWLYIYDYKALALDVCNVLETVPFTGNFNLWSWVETALALKARILQETGNDEEAQRVVTQLQRTFDADDKSLARRLKGDLLRNEDVEEAIREKDTRTEKDYRFVNLRELTFIRAMGQPNDDIEEQIRQNVRRLQ